VEQQPPSPSLPCPVLWEEQSSEQSYLLAVGDGDEVLLPLLVSVACLPLNSCVYVCVCVCGVLLFQAQGYFL
jgi:hypothetical protein